MPVSYALFENNLTSDPDDYMAMVQPANTADLDIVVDRMMQQGSTVTRADVVSTLEDFFSAVENILLEGTNVVTPVANFSVSIKGVFNGRTDTYDSNRHHVTPTISSGKRLRRTIASRAQPLKQEAIKPRPNPLDYIDFVSNTRNTTLTPGGMGQIIGHRLKFDATDANQGIFLVDNNTTATRITTIGRNMPAELMFMIPTGLTPGDYTLEVRAIFANEIRLGVLPTTLTAA